jgi:glycosyltransferase involved in cell wall biosynthesis
MKIKKKNILFFGEFPDKVAHGVSISNKININALRDYFKVFCIQELSFFGISRKKYFFLKIIEMLILPYKIFLYRKVKLNIFYFTLSLSVFGSVKNLFLLLIVSVFVRCDKFIAHIHRGDLEVLYYQSYIVRFIVKCIFNMLDSIIVSSESQVEFIAENFDVEIFVLKNTIEYSNTSPLLSKSDNKNVRFLFFSNFIKEKGIFELFEAFSKLNKEFPNVTLSICGKPKTLKTLNLIKINMPRNTSIIKPIYGDDKYKIYDNHDVFVLPSWSEGQPLSIIEAMYRGLAVVVTDVGGVLEMLPKNYPAIAKPRNISDLHLKMRQMMLFATRKQLGESLREKFNDDFSKEKHNVQIKKIFQFAL